MRKTGDDYVRRTNAEDREDIIKNVGRHEFETCGYYKDLQDKQVPPCFQYVFDVFLELYNSSGENGITFTDIDTYCRVRNVRLAQTEIDYILRCKGWASQQIHKMEDEEK